MKDAQTTSNNRHRCQSCGAVRYEKFMTLVQSAGKYGHWECQDCDTNHKDWLRFNGVPYVALRVDMHGPLA